MKQLFNLIFVLSVLISGAAISDDNSVLLSMVTAPAIGVTKNGKLGFSLADNPKIYASGNYKLFHEDGRVEFRMSAGPLKPQVIELLLQHQLIHNKEGIQWLASSNFIWPSAHLLQGKSLDHVLNDLLKPYRLVAEFKGNSNVVIDKF